MRKIYPFYATKSGWADLWREFDELLQTEISTPSETQEETEDNIVLNCPVAGFGPEDIQVEWIDDLIKISCEQKSEKSKNKLNRALRVPVGCQVDKSTASCKNGMLTIVLPKTQKSKGTNKIKVTGEV